MVTATIDELLNQVGIDLKVYKAGMSVLFVLLKAGEAGNKVISNMSETEAKIAAIISALKTIQSAADNGNLGSVSELLKKPIEIIPPQVNQFAPLHPANSSSRSAFAISSDRSAFFSPIGNW